MTKSQHDVETDVRSSPGPTGPKPVSPSPPRNKPNSASAFSYFFYPMLISSTEYPPHSHANLTAHVILSGQLTIACPRDGDAEQREKRTTYGAGDRIDVDVGKTCLALALAGHFHRNVYIVCPPVNDSNLKTLVARVPPRSIIVFEGVENANSQPWEGSASLSAILDTIDSAEDGHLIIITTHNIELVDGALMGPSRVAVTAEFGLADRNDSWALPIFMMSTRQPARSQ